MADKIYISKMMIFVNFFFFPSIALKLINIRWIRTGSVSHTEKLYIASYYIQFSTNKLIGAVVIKILSYRKKPYYFIIRKCCMFMPRLKSAELATLMFIYSHHCRQLANLEQNRIYAPPQFYTFKHFSLKGFEKILFFWSRKDFLAKL